MRMFKSAMRKCCAGIDDLHTSTDYAIYSFCHPEKERDQLCSLVEKSSRGSGVAAACKFLLGEILVEERRSISLDVQDSVKKL